jgi:two-component system OmpR family sensor kinase
LISRLPIRVKVTLAFAGAMAVLLALMGIALYQLFAAQLDDTVNQGLRSRAGDVSALIQRGDTGLAAPGRSVLVERGESFAQILAADGTVLDGSPKLQAKSLLTAGQVRRAVQVPSIIIERPNPFEPGEPARLLATPVNLGGQRLLVVVGAGIDDRNSQLATLALVLAIGGPIALLFASLAGYGVASAALRPVDAMRRKADEITEADPGGRLPVGAADDEIARLGVTLNGMLARLEQAMERERAFVADASHELRTPLAILKTEIELALRGDRPPAELRQALQSAAVETDRLSELADALLVIARAHGGRLRLATAEVNSERLFAEVELRFQARARLAGRDVVACGSHQRFTADPRRIELALDNLVDNALQHGTGTVRLSAEGRDGVVELHVRDEGPGFPPQFLSDAFERFTRADRARGRGGAGLGLSIVQVIARAHGGEARAINQADGGADIVIELPRDGPPPS